jgi:hypothetical protein
MFDQDSRYSEIGRAVHVTSDGREITYVQRRFLPPGEALPLLTEVTIKDGDRLDLIAARTLGQVEQRWRIADANNAMRLQDLLSEPGKVLRVPVPQVVEPL